MGKIRTRYLLAFAFGLILVGFAFVLIGSATSGSTGGCFIWPFPVIIVCGAGSGGTPYVFILLGLAAVVIMSFLSLVWMRRSLSDSGDR